MSALADLSAIVIDCAEPASLGEFYRKVTGWAVTYSDNDYVYLGNDGPVQLGFQRVAGYRAPEWPGAARQAHVDLKVADVEGAAREVLALGGSRPDFQPGAGKWVVLADPEGNVFCLTPAE